MIKWDQWRIVYYIAREDMPNKLRKENNKSVCMFHETNEGRNEKKNENQKIKVKISSLNSNMEVRNFRITHSEI